ncbi:hypothetical protein Pint_16242 [Pistacia integerrima]|uniref:Uncharacterized protein n=1 Tax=Pistacia integerrima TaxID=434235 RepID=A0ACC0Z9P2_9ROSI|nr:hypothetical protein Pint_16242 [Pistacia integerrima]
MVIKVLQIFIAMYINPLIFVCTKNITYLFKTHSSFITIEDLIDTMYQTVYLVINTYKH